MKNKDARSLPSAAQEQLRRRAVQVVRDGMTQLEAARRFGVTRQTIWSGSKKPGTKAWMFWPRSHKVGLKEKLFRPIKQR